MAVERLPDAEWVTRCAARLRHADPALDAEAAAALAGEMLRFPRTAAMTPEDAVDFVTHELAKHTPRFERRRVPR